VIRKFAVSLLLTIFVGELFISIPAVFAEEEYQCTLTIDANKHDWYNRAFPTSGCEGSVVNGYYDEQGFKLMGSNVTGKNAENGEVYYLSGGFRILVRI